MSCVHEHDASLGAAAENANKACSPFRWIQDPGIVNAGLLGYLKGTEPH